MEWYRFIIFGKVQGVFHRKFVSQSFMKKQFKGYIQNLSDGTVEIVAEIFDEDFDLSVLFDFHEISKLNNEIYEISETKNKRKIININHEKCSWDIEIEYKNYDSDLRPYLFSYTNKDNQKISAKLRKYKKSAKVRLSLFKMPIIKKVLPINAEDGLVN